MSGLWLFSWLLANQPHRLPSGFHCHLLIHTTLTVSTLYVTQPGGHINVVNLAGNTHRSEFGVMLLWSLVDGGLTVPLLQSVLAAGGRWEHCGVWRQRSRCTPRHGGQSLQVTRHVYSGLMTVSDTATGTLFLWMNDRPAELRKLVTPDVFFFFLQLYWNHYTTGLQRLM